LHQNSRSKTEDQNCINTPEVEQNSIGHLLTKGTHKNITQISHYCGRMIIQNAQQSKKQSKKAYPPTFTQSPRLFTQFSYLFTQFPHEFHDISTLFSRKSHTISTQFPHNFNIVFTRIPHDFQIFSHNSETPPHCSQLNQFNQI